MSETDEDNTGGQHVAIRTDSLVPDGDMMGHEQLPPVPTPLEPPFSNILKRDLGRNYKGTVYNFTYIALLDEVKSDPVQELHNHPPPTKSGTTNTHNATFLKKRFPAIFKYRRTCQEVKR